MQIFAILRSVCTDIFCQSNLSHVAQEVDSQHYRNSRRRDYSDGNRFVHFDGKVCISTVVQSAK